MAARKAGNQQPATSERPQLVVSREEAQTRIEAQITAGEQLIATPPRSEAELETYKAEFYTWDEFNHELLKALFTGDSVAGEYRGWAMAFGNESHLPLQRRWEYHVDTVRNYIRRLRSITGRLSLFQVQSENRPNGTGAGASVGAAKATRGKKVFVVHGHDNEALQSVARFLSRLELEPIILHEQASGGRTIIEKLEHYGDVGFAVILLTPDDVGAAKAQAAELKPRARQNVVLELGYFVGRLGRDRVCALHRSNLELPSDVVGVVYVELDSAGGWHLTLAREIKAAGLAIDMNNAV